MNSRYDDAIDAIAREALRESDARVRISGHTDTYGDEAYNRALSTRRAAAARDALIRSGVPEDRIDLEGLGADRPAFPNDSLDSRRGNRRAEIEILR